jgi:PAS domain S-box-containing protein
MGENLSEKINKVPPGICESTTKSGILLHGRTIIPAAASDTETKVGLDILDIIDAIPFYVLLVDSDHYIIEANNAVKTYLGVEREDILGKYCPKVIHGLDQPFHGCPLEEAAEKNEAVERELFDEKTGRWVASAIYPTRALSKDGKRIFLHMVTDVTARIEAQEQLKASHGQLRRLSAHLESVREQEKREIARDLHDETSQVLASLHAYLEAAIENLPGDADKTRELLKRAQTLSTTILDEIHKLIYELRPAALDELGLIAAVKSMLSSFAGMTATKLSFKTTGRVRRLSPSLEVTLFRIVQEAFNNIIKHSRAKNASAVISFNNSSVMIRIQDDGIGFNVQKVLNWKSRPPGMGLLGMRERVTLVNGSLVINSAPGQGTELVIEVPIASGVQNG